jgi:hypothetical protein
MSLRDEGQLLMRIQLFKEMRSKVAKDKAHELGLTNLTPDQQARFEKDYWSKRLQVDRELAKQFEPALKAREQKMKEELFREFSTPGVAGVPAPQKPKPPVAQTKPAPAPAPAPAPTPAPVTPVTTTGASSPMMQSHGE